MVSLSQILFSRFVAVLFGCVAVCCSVSQCCSGEGVVRYRSRRSCTGGVLQLCSGCVVVCFGYVSCVMRCVAACLSVAVVRGWGKIAWADLDLEICGRCVAVVLRLCCGVFQCCCWQGVMQYQ